MFLSIMPISAILLAFLATRCDSFRLGQGQSLKSEVRGLTGLTDTDCKAMGTMKDGNQVPWAYESGFNCHRPTTMNAIVTSSYLENGKKCTEAASALCQKKSLFGYQKFGFGIPIGWQACASDNYDDWYMDIGCFLDENKPYSFTLEYSDACDEEDSNVYDNKCIEKVSAKCTENNNGTSTLGTVYGTTSGGFKVGCFLREGDVAADFFELGGNDGVTTEDNAYLCNMDSKNTKERGLLYDSPRCRALTTKYCGNSIHQKALNVKAGPNLGGLLYSYNGNDHNSFADIFSFSPDDDLVKVACFRYDQRMLARMDPEHQYYSNKGGGQWGYTGDQWSTF